MYIPPPFFPPRMALKCNSMMSLLFLLSMLLLIAGKDGGCMGYVLSSSKIEHCVMDGSQENPDPDCEMKISLLLSLQSGQVRIAFQTRSFSLTLCTLTLCTLTLYTLTLCIYSLTLCMCANSMQGFVEDVDFLVSTAVNENEEECVFENPIKISLRRGNTMHAYPITYLQVCSLLLHLCASSSIGTAAAAKHAHISFCRWLEWNGLMKGIQFSAL
jgi:hypothetical protein